MNDLQIKHHIALLEMRCQDRLVQSDNFVAAWEVANVKQRRTCYKMLRKLKVDELKIWIANVLFSDLDAQRIKSLRQLASNHRILNYSNMSKEELLKILTSKGVSHGKSGCRS